MSGAKQDINVTMEDFRGSGWKEAVDGTLDAGYWSLYSRLSKEAQQASRTGDAKRARVLELLADACSMMLEPDNPGEPFEPFCVWEGRRSAIPEDFPEEVLQLFEAALPEIDHVWLKARLADLIWVRQRDHEKALIAIDAYRAIRFEDRRWSYELKCWKRALSLARSLRDSKRLLDMKAAILSNFRNDTAKEAFLALKLSDLLLDLGLSGDECLEIATALECRAQEHEKCADNRSAGIYFEACIKWFTRSGDSPRSTAAKVALAESCEREALARQSSTSPSNFAAIIHYGRAIEHYKDVPKVARKAYGVDERIRELQHRRREAGKRSLDEMTTYSTEPIDISVIAEQSQKMIGGKSWLEAITTLAKVMPGACKSNIEEAARQILLEHPLQSTTTGVHLTSDGRVTTKSPGVSSSTGDSEGDANSLHEQMISQYRIYIGISVMGYIVPALEVVRTEHCIDEADFVSLAQNSPVVPTGRERLVGKALYCGFKEDFATSLYLLAPQVEHMVRTRLKDAGAITAHLDTDGVETENGLGALVDIPEMEEVFGGDLGFEIRSLFCDPVGPNLRNEVAHGLVDDDASQQDVSIYAWWFFLRLIFLPLQ